MTMWRRTAAVPVFLLCAAGALHAQHTNQAVFDTATEVFNRVGALKPMQYGKVYTLSAGGKLMTGGPDDFLRRRTAEEILASGLTTGSGDIAIVALSVAAKRGLEAAFVDSAQISTQSLEYGFAGTAVIAVRDPKSGVWARIDGTLREVGFPFPPTQKSLYGSYWVGFRGRLADYPAHDPESLKKFYRDTLNTIPPEVLNKHLFRFAFSVESSLRNPDGALRNPNLGRFLADNGKILAAHGVHPVSEIAIRLVAGRQDAESYLDYSDKDGWVCALGLQSACGLDLVSYFERVLNDAQEKDQLHAGAASAAPATPPAPTAPAASSWLLWTGCGVLCAGLLAVLVWQRRRLAGREAAIAYWLCQLLGWGSLLAGAAIAAHRVPEHRVNALVNGSVYFASGILLSALLRGHIRRRGWLTLPTKRMVVRASAAVVLLSAVQTALISASFPIVRAFGEGATQRLSDVLGDWLINAVLWTVWTSLYVLLTGPRRHRETEMRLQLALREAELRALEAQINPHFLFNCLNSIRGLVIENPPKAQDMVTRLANILRYNLRRDIEHTVPLSSEVEIVGDYLALESARFEDRLRVHLSIDPDAGEVQVPPMLLQTLVENALKHGIAPLPAGGDLLIRAAVVGDSVVMEVDNPGQIAESAPQATQMGLANIRERLRLVYDGRASLELKNRNGRVAATVVIPKTV
ncbi:MAG TPA: histidine kinase [Bryobacteraceae bacterium]|nr:histidine kinase [Bryobacteraceae bacterium]